MDEVVNIKSEDLPLLVGITDGLGSIIANNNTDSSAIVTVLGTDADEP